MQPMFVNGRATPGHASGAIEVRDPASEELIESVPRGGAADVEDEDEPFEERFPRLRSALTAHFEESRRLSRTIETMLEGVACGV